MLAAHLRTLQRSLPFLAAVIFSASIDLGCRRGATTAGDGGGDAAGIQDASGDAGVEGDAGREPDAGDGDDAGSLEDAGSGDAGMTDAGAGDAGNGDAGRDAGARDAGSTCCSMGETRSCDVCGRAGTETCQANCIWGTCQTPQAPPCFPNQRRNCTSACGNAGTQTCSDVCAWSACEPEVFEECSRPSSTRACGDACGTAGLQTCSASCTWGACVTNANSCTPSTSRTCQNICGNAGVQQCSVSCTWGSCEGGSLGSCVPAAVVSCEDSCGNFGTQVCGPNCEWDACDSGFTCALDTVEVPASTDGTVFCGKADGGFQGCTDTAGNHCATSCCGDQIGITGGTANDGPFCFSTRYLVRFPHLVDAVPVGSTVSKVELIVTPADLPRDSCNFEADAFRAAWDDETVNWNNLPATTTGVARAIAPDAGPSLSFDVTNDALSMIRGNLAENGWVLRASPDADCLANPNRYNTDCHISLPSICQMPSLDEASWPRLRIKYRP